MCTCVQPALPWTVTQGEFKVFKFSLCLFFIKYIIYHDFSFVHSQWTCSKSDAWSTQYPKPQILYSQEVSLDNKYRELHSQCLVWPILRAMAWMHLATKAPTSLLWWAMLFGDFFQWRIQGKHGVPFALGILLLSSPPQAHTARSFILLLISVDKLFLYENTSHHMKKYCGLDLPFSIYFLLPYVFLF